MTTCAVSASSTSFSRARWRDWSRRLGPEPLSRSFTARVLGRTLARSRSPIRSLLLDQRKIAGVGNIYAVEALWFARIHPATPANAIREPAPARLHRSLRRVLRRAIRAGGTTLRNYRTVEGDVGGFSRALHAYGREGRALYALPHADRAGRVRRPFRLPVPALPGAAFPMMRAPTALWLIALPLLVPPASALLAPPRAAAQDAPATVAGMAPGEALPVTRHTLANGMTFLILPRRQSPTVSLVVHYPVGSVNEHLGNTGIAHVVEHMLFKGSEEIGTRNRAAELPLLDAADAARDSMIAELAGPAHDSAEVRRLQGLVNALEGQGAGVRDPERVRPHPHGPRRPGAQRDHRRRGDPVLRRTPGQPPGAVVSLWSPTG